MREHDAPDYAMPVVAWRLWRIDPAGVLYSPQQGTEWQPGYNDAACPHAGKRRARYVPADFRPTIDEDEHSTAPPDFSFEIFTVPMHTAPGDDCGCGFYAVDKPTEAVIRGWASNHRATSSCLGTVEIVGDAVRHRDGWRAARARVAGLVSSADDDIDTRIALALARYDAQRHSPDDDLGVAARRRRSRPPTATEGSFSCTWDRSYTEFVSSRRCLGDRQAPDLALHSRWRRLRTHRPLPIPIPIVRMNRHSSRRSRRQGQAGRIPAGVTEGT